MIYTLRNPISIFFLIFMGFFQSFLQASLYWKFADVKFSIFAPTSNEQLVRNMLGLSFLVAQDQLIMNFFG